MTARAFSPRDYQEVLIDHMARRKRCALWVGMGMGKTSSVLEALARLALVEKVFPVLVLAPLRVAKTTWPEEIAKWSDFSHLTISVVAGDKSERRAAVRAKADIYTINYENLPWLVEHFGDYWPFVTVVADESTRLKSFRLRQGGKRAQALAKLAHTKINRFIELTGTPSPNGLIDLWGQMWFLDQGQRLGRTFSAFCQRWFSLSHDGFSLTPLPNAGREIQEKLSDLCLSLDAEDWFDLTAPIVNVIRVDMPQGARRIYNDMEKRMFVELESANGEHSVEAFNAAARTMKCLQLANGAIYTEDNNTKWTEIHDEKIKALESIIEEAAGAPVLVAYHFKSDLERLQRAFSYGRTLDAVPSTVTDWNRGRIRLLFAHPSSAGHGLNLQDGGNTIVFFAHNWNLEEHQQIIERIGPTRQMQAGHKRPVFIHHIIARGTVEELVLKRLETKRDVQELLIEAMKTRNQNG